MEIKRNVFMWQMLELIWVRNRKSILHSLDDGGLIHCILCFPDKKYQCLKNKTHVNLITNLNFVKMQHCRQMESIWTFHQQNVGRFVGPQAARARPGWAMLMRGRSLLGQSSRYLAMMTRPVLTKLFKAWAMIVVLTLFYGILISSRTRHKSASN